MNRTTNYNLCQFEENDRVRRTDFNEDNAKLDAALTGLTRSKADLSALTVKTEVAAGAYTGDGAAERVISLGFTPKALYVCSENGITYVGGNYGNSYRGGLAVPGAPIVSHGYSILEIVSGGFKVFYTEVKLNSASTNHYGANTASLKFHYIAFK
ncbi:hypothetical protein N510_002325 [Firmicutes bacterium ASF500]|nr:hypothetical protein N510_002325 [Firmicutes bacterium ASF500]